MKKSLLSILLIIPVLWGIMTWVASHKTEDIFNNMLAQSQQKINETVPILTIEKLSFNKGFISSTAKSIIRINPEIFDATEPLKITLDHVIYHGPLMLTSDGIKLGTSYIKTSLDQEPIEEKSKATIALIFAGKQPFISNTLTGFSDNITEFIDIPTLHIDAKALDFLQDDNSNVVLDLAGITGEMTTNSAASFLEGYMTTGALNITGTSNSENFSLVAKQSLTQLDIDELYRGAVLLGSVTFELPEILINSGQQDISLKDISFTNSGTEQGNFYSQSVNIDINKLFINANRAGTTLPESKFHFGFNLKGLEKSATRHLIDISQTLSESQAALLSNDSAQAQQQLEASIRNYLHAISALVNPDLTSNIKIELSNDKGRSTIDFDLNYVATENLLELETIKDLIIALSLELRVNIDKNMVAGTAIEQLINSPMSGNALISNGHTYTANMTLDNGQLILNGEPIPALDMLGDIANQPLDWDQYLQ